MLLILMIIMRLYLFLNPFVQYEKLEILAASCSISQGPVSQGGIVNCAE